MKYSNLGLIRRHQKNKNNKNKNNYNKFFTGNTTFAESVSI